jgi:hypothetical protein
MKVVDARHTKRERLQSGVRYALSERLDLKQEAKLAELPPFFLREHHLCRLLATRYAESVATVLEGFPDGEIPPDVLESHVDALVFHDEAYAQRLFATADQTVRVLRGTTTVVRRFYQWLDQGDLFLLGGRQFRVTEVGRERLSDVTADGASREGVSSVEEWRRRWVENLPRSAGAAEWTPDQLCVRHEFVATDLAPPR